MKATFIKATLIAMIGAAALSVLTWWLAPGLISDVGLRGQSLQPVDNAKVTESWCRTKVLALSFCNIKYADERGTQQEFGYLFFGHPIDGGMKLLTAADGSGRVTTNVAMAHLTNRLVTFIMFMIMVIGGLGLRIHGIMKR